jgi:hypothetical protein
MSTALSPEPDDPQGSGLPGDGWDAGESIPQGLYVTAPAEDLTLDGFAEHGRADTMEPGPLLAMVLDTVADLHRTRLRPPRRALRPGPHPPAPPRRPHV